MLKIVFLIIVSSIFLWGQEIKHKKACVIIDTKATLYQNSVGFDEHRVVLDAKKDFIKRVTVTADKGSRYGYVIEDNKESIIWIDKSYLLCEDSGYISALDLFEGSKSALSVKKKALIVTDRKSIDNNDPTIEKDPDNPLTIRVKIYTTPPTADVDDEYYDDYAKLFYKPRYVYAERQIKDQTYYLVGTEQVVRAARARIIENIGGKQVVSGIEGWVNADKVKLWNNKVALKPTPVTHNITSLQIYSTPNLQGQFELDKDKPMQYFEHRLPIISEIGASAYEILYIGGAGGVSRSQLNEQQFVYSQIQHNDLLQIALVMDATSGMSPHFAKVKQAIAAFRDFAKDKANLQIAITVYRDYADGEGIFEVVQNFDASTDSDLTQIKAYSDKKDVGQWGLPEALFNGINSSVNDLGWSKRRIPKYMIILGDHGNHSKALQSKKDSSLTINNLAQHLRQNYISLFAIQVYNQGKGKTSLQNFQQQLTTIMQKSGRRADQMVSYANASQQNITDRLKAIYSSFDNTKKGDSQELQSVGVDTDSLSQVQLTAQGFIAKDNHIAQEVLIERGSLKLLIVSMQQLTKTLKKGFSSSKGHEDSKKAIKKVYKALSGDDIDDKTNIMDAIYAKTGLPLQTPALDQSVSQLVNQLRRSTKKRKAFIKNIETKVQKMQAVFNERDWRQKGNKITFLKGKCYFYNITSIGKNACMIGQDGYIERNQEIDNDPNIRAWMPVEYLP